MPHKGPRAFLILCAVAAFLCAHPASAATWTADATISNERKTDVTEEDSGKVTRSSAETFKQSYALSYAIKINPVLELGLKFTLDVSDNIKEGPKDDTDYDSRQLKPKVDFQLKGVWWDLAVGWTKNFDTSNDPKKPNIEDWGWAIDVGITPKSDAVPDVKLKYKEADKSIDGETIKIDDSWDVALDYKFMKSTSVSITASRALFDDKVQQDSDKEDRKYSASLGFQKDLLKKAKLDAKWSNDRAQSRTFFDDGEEKDRTDTLKNSVEGKASYKPFDSLELSTHKKFGWNTDLQKSTEELTDTLTSKIAYDESFTKELDFKASYDDVRTEKSYTDSDSRKISRAYSTSVGYSPAKYLSITPSYDRKIDLESFEDPGKRASQKTDDKLNFKGESSLLKDRVKISMGRSFSRTAEKDRITARQNKWNVDLALTVDSVPNLDINPKYTQTNDVDSLKGTVAGEKKVDVNVKYAIDLGSVSKFSLDHTYGRSDRVPATGKSTVRRNDSSNLTLGFTDFFKGMKAEVKYSRKASDESEDDKPRQIDYTYGLTYDWIFLKKYKYAVAYSFDRKAASEDTQSLKNSLNADFLSGLIVLSLQYEFTERLEGKTKDAHRYLIELKGKF